ncbi:DUF2909 domain-containing protein [Halomonas sp. 18H]|uniref:DUF2909 domain-containing protein n=1 Tax=Halomonas almeriensis TaxID=308163 RepID=UPI00222FB209|nr:MULTISPECIES: DUF2909 domain-containing protein [Halomonas]MCW4151793.1 DUF2909 domain-containing protein [Halomonas sp. 18H]MDN3554039.1 DUF2909 domain-containing protein [Halomonas almeriensis]
MLIKILVALIFIAMLASLAAGAGWLMKDGGRSRRVLISLKLRVCLATLLLALLVYGFLSGQLGH